MLIHFHPIILNSCISTKYLQNNALVEYIDNWTDNPIAWQLYTKIVKNNIQRVSHKKHLLIYLYANFLIYFYVH